jgi:hypothetical protein
MIDSARTSCGQAHHRPEHADVEHDRLADPSITVSYMGS